MEVGDTNGLSHVRSFLRAVTIGVVRNLDVILFMHITKNECAAGGLFIAKICAILKEATTW